MSDVIDRHAAIDALSAILDNPNHAEFLYGDEICKTLQDLPSSERRGRWEDIEHAPNGLLYATCSACGKRQTVECTNYCGNCGARLEAA